MLSRQRILILEDDTSLARTLTAALSKELGYSVSHTNSLDRCYTLIDQCQVSLLIADWMLGKRQTSLELVEYVNQYHRQIKILMLTQVQGFDKRLKVYKQGADAYLSKPFELAELSALIKKLMNVYKLSDSPQHIKGMFNLQLESGKVLVNNNEYNLRPKEMEILRALLVHSPKVVSKRCLIDYVWPHVQDQPSENTIEVYIRRLRQLLGEAGGQIKNKRGYGYYLITE